MKFKYLVIEGNIGAGKTSLAKIISQKYNSHLVLEEFAENTFLEQFYQHPDRFAFPLELSFLAERFRQLGNVQQTSFKNNHPVVSDYLFDKSFVFASVNLPGAELYLYEKFFRILQPQLTKPELVVYLHKSPDVLLRNISKRGRSFEKELKREYLESVEKSYNSFFNSTDHFNILKVDTDHLDFINEPSHLQHLLNLIQKRLE